MRYSVIKGLDELKEILAKDNDCGDVSQTNEHEIDESIFDEIYELTDIQFTSELKDFYIRVNKFNDDINLLIQSPEYIENKSDLTVYKIEEAYNEWKLFHPYDEEHYDEWSIDEQEISFVDKRIKPYLHHKYWWPVASGANIELYYDMDPTMFGRRGQMIAYVHDYDFIYYIEDSLGKLIAKSNEGMGDWLGELKSIFDFEEDETCLDDDVEEIEESIYDLIDIKKSIFFDRLRPKKLKGEMNFQEGLKFLLPNFIKYTFTSYFGPIKVLYDAGDAFALWINIASQNKDEDIQKWSNDYKNFMIDRCRNRNLEILCQDRCKVDEQDSMQIALTYDDVNNKRMYRKSTFVFSNLVNKKYEICLSCNRNFDEQSRYVIDSIYNQIIESIRFIDNCKLEENQFILDEYSVRNYEEKIDFESNQHAVNIKIPKEVQKMDVDDLRIIGEYFSLTIKSNDKSEKEIFKARLNTYENGTINRYWDCTESTQETRKMYGVDVKIIRYEGVKRRYMTIFFEKNERYYYMVAQYSNNNDTQKSKDIIWEMLESITFMK